jgi:hypothetical protein
MIRGGRCNCELLATNVVGFCADNYRPVRTFDTAVIYFHKFRLVHRDTEYAYPDAAAAALFTACKIEDTLKKSKEILCASYNLKVSPSEHLTPDDNVFESSLYFSGLLLTDARSLRRHQKLSSA